MDMGEGITLPAPTPIPNGGGLPVHCWGVCVEEVFWVEVSLCTKEMVEDREKDRRPNF